MASDDVLVGLRREVAELRGELTRLRETLSVALKQQSAPNPSDVELSSIRERLATLEGAAVAGAASQSPATRRRKRRASTSRDIQPGVATDEESEGGEEIYDGGGPHAAPSSGVVAPSAPASQVGVSPATEALRSSHRDMTFGHLGDDEKEDDKRRVMQQQQQLLLPPLPQLGLPPCSAFAIPHLVSHESAPQASSCVVVAAPLPLPGVPAPSATTTENKPEVLASQALMDLLQVPSLPHSPSLFGSLSSMELPPPAPPQAAEADRLLAIVKGSSSVTRKTSSLAVSSESPSKIKRSRESLTDDGGSCDTDFGTSGPKRKRGKLPEIATITLKQWLYVHQNHPYPTEEEKSDLSSKTGLSLNQINNWFTNARRRLLPPKCTSPFLAHGGSASSVSAVAAAAIGGQAAIMGSLTAPPSRSTTPTPILTSARQPIAQRPGGPTVMTRAQTALNMTAEAQRLLNALEPLRGLGTKGISDNS